MWLPGKKKPLLFVAHSEGDLKGWMDAIRKGRDQTAAARGVANALAGAWAAAGRRYSK